MLKRIFLLFLFPLLCCFGFVSDDQPKQKRPPIKIQWTTVKGDFSFTEEWMYPIGVYRDELGQLVCDGWCPEGIAHMRDSTGKIYPDSLRHYYELVDTTHRYRSLKGEAWCYEYAGADFIFVEKIAKNKVVCSTLSDPDTHCTLLIEIQGDYCVPKIGLRSVSPSGDRTYYYDTGSIRIDKECWNHGILKAQFDFTFKNTDGPKKMFWKGLIYKEITELKF